MIKDFILKKELDRVIEGMLLESKQTIFSDVYEKNIFLSTINDSDFLITLHDVELHRPLCFNNLFKEFYGFETNWFKNEDYLYYLQLIHPSTIRKLADSSSFFKEGGVGYLELKYRLREEGRLWRNINGITKTLYWTKTGIPKYAITVAKYDKEELLELEKMMRLTVREKEIFQFLPMGYTQKEIANLLYITYETVHSHVKNIYKKLEINKVSELASLAERYLIK